MSDFMYMSLNGSQLHSNIRHALKQQMLTTLARTIQKVCNHGERYAKVILFSYVRAILFRLKANFEECSLKSAARWRSG